MKTIKYKLTGILILFSCINIAAQDFVSKNVAEKFAEQGSVTTVNNLLTLDNNYSDAGISSAVKKSQFYVYNATKAAELIANQAEVISIQVQHNNESLTLDLVNSSEYFSQLQATTSSGDFPGNNLNAVFYRGVIRGKEKTSLVSLSVFANEVSGYISADKGNLVLGKIEGASEHIIYNDNDIIPPFNFECSNVNEDLDHEEQLLYDGASVSNTTAILSKCVKLYYETEFDIFQNKGSYSNVLNYVTALHNHVANMYYNEGILTLISNVHIWNTTDPYTATTTADLLNQFKSNTSYINGDLGQLLTFRSVGGGRAAGFSGICNSNVDNKLSVSMIYTSFSNLPLYSWSVNVITHEFGHLFGSRHTHACVWNGNNTPIDACGPSQGYNFENITISCLGAINNGVEIPADGGTIMSYCHTVSNIGINFRKGFGIQPGNVLRSRVSNGSCLGQCTNCITTLHIFTPVTSSQDFKVSQQLTASSSINNNLVVNYQARQVLLTSGFVAKGNTTGKFRAYINPCIPDNVFSKPSNQQGDDGEDALNSSSSSHHLILYPNPNKGIFTLSVDESIKEMLQIEIYNSYGKIVQMNTIDPKEIAKEFNLVDAPAGIYFVKVSGKNINENIKFVKH